VAHAHRREKGCRKKPALTSQTPRSGDQTAVFGGKKAQPGTSGTQRHGKRKQPCLRKKRRKKTMIVASAVMKTHAPVSFGQIGQPCMQ